MNKRFRCGRLTLTKNGEVKKVDLGNGGGSRFCEWSDNDMTFNDIHNRLINIFNLGDTRYDTSLYDFRLRPLQMGEHATFLEYMHNNGLTRSGTVIYICTNEADRSKPPQKKRKKKKKKKNRCATRTSIPEEKTSIEDKDVVETEVDADADVDQEELYQSNYSYTNTSNDLLKNIRDLLNENNFDEMLIKLFENVCIIHGYVCSTIEFVKTQIPKSNSHSSSLNSNAITFYSNSLINLWDIIQSTKSLIKFNENKFNHIDHFTIVIKLFIEFYENVKILINQWFNHADHKKNTPESSSLFINSSDSTFSTFL